MPTQEVDYQYKILEDPEGMFKQMMTSQSEFLLKNLKRPVAEKNSDTKGASTSTFFEEEQEVGIYIRARLDGR